MASWFPSGKSLPNPGNSLPPYQAPVPFSPLDISGCVLWLDAADDSTVEVNQDTSGNNVNRVMKWYDKADQTQQNHYEHDNQPFASGLYNTHTINQKPVVYFEPNCYMIHHGNGETFNFQAKTFFYVIKPRVDLSGAILHQSIYTSTEANGIGLGIDASGGLFRYSMRDVSGSDIISFDLSDNPYKIRMIVSFAQTDQIDLSGNLATYDVQPQLLSSDNYAQNYSTAQQQYVLNDSANGGSLDIAEIILYSSLLTTLEQEQVLIYLADKWSPSGQGLH